ncbi:hypothetical protein [Caulobacter sp. DWP3-1-3b2]|uniref:hypothetical protein n=1 Tax=Caulobacter sp. DWP3-1-3b2 TaxID=2804643 RepID=UPI003CFAB6A5
MMDPGELDRMERVLERRGWQARPLARGEIAPELMMALEAALAAGACRRAAALNPESKLTWIAVAEAKRRDALGHLRMWAVSVSEPVGRSRA